MAFAIAPLESALVVVDGNLNSFVCNLWKSNYSCIFFSKIIIIDNYRSGNDCATSTPPETTVTVLRNVAVTDTGISEGMFAGFLVMACW